MKIKNQSKKNNMYTKKEMDKIIRFVEVLSNDFVTSIIDEAKGLSFKMISGKLHFLPYRIINEDIL
jgi:hypothetical protein